MTDIKYDKNVFDFFKSVMVLVCFLTNRHICVYYLHFRHVTNFVVINDCNNDIKSIKCFNNDLNRIINVPVLCTYINIK